MVGIFYASPYKQATAELYAFNKAKAYEEGYQIMAINNQMRRVLKALSFDGIEVEGFKMSWRILVSN